MKVWIVTETYYNGEFDEDRFHSVWHDEEEAKAWVLEQNAARTSSYQSSYEVSWEDHEIRTTKHVAEPGEIEGHEDRLKTLDAVSKGYDFTIDNDGRLQCLVSGDMGWSATDIVLTPDAVHVDFAEKVCKHWEEN